MEFLLSIIIGVFSSLIATLVFLSFFKRIRPKILISDHIARHVDDEGKKRYVIKVINRAKRPAIKLKAEFHVVGYRIVKGGPIHRGREVSMIKSELLDLPAYDKNDMDFLFAFRFRIYDDLESLWDDDEKSFLRFRLFATDSLSGFSKVFEAKYYTKRNTFKKGDFARGDTFEVV